MSSRQTHSRFSVAVHLLALTSDGRNGAVTSERMAEGVNANPVVLRRILGALRDAGLVTSRPGPGGGWRLARPLETITLRDVYRAVERRPAMSGTNPAPDVDFAPGKRLPHVVERCVREAEDAMAERLSRVTIASVITSAFSEAGRSGGPPRFHDEKEVPISRMP